MQRSDAPADPRRAPREVGDVVGRVVVVLLCVGGSIYLAVLASLSVSRPLADLAAEAETVADERLPAAMLRLRAFDPSGGGRLRWWRWAVAAFCCSALPPS